VFSGTNNGLAGKLSRWHFIGCLLNGHFVGNLFKSTACIRRTGLAQSYTQACPVFSGTNLLVVIKRLANCKTIG
jgi:hypothetical protein